MVQVVVRALRILEFVATHGNEPVQMIKIAEHLGLSQPTTANIVKTLLDNQYLEQLGRKKGYRLGIGAYNLTGSLAYSQDLAAAAKEQVDELNKQLNETALFAVIRNNKRVILYMAECNQALQVRTEPVVDVYNAATGRLLMAYLPPKELNSLITAIGLPSKTTWPGAETREGLEKLLQEIREQEFVQVLSIHHTVGLAVPVYRSGQVVASLSVFVPASRYTNEHQEKIRKLVGKAAKKITERLEKAKD